MSKVHVIDHPLVQHKMAIIRDVRTGPKEFRELVDEVALLMAYEVTRDMALEDVEVETPMGMAQCRMISGKKIGVIPILRAGLGMVNGIIQLIPAAKVGHIGLYRDPESLQPVEYYCKLPTDIGERDLIVLDPMLATGGSAVAAIRFIKEKGGKKLLMVLSPHRKELQQCRLPTQMWKFSLLPLMKGSMSSVISSLGLAMPGIGFLGPSSGRGDAICQKGMGALAGINISWKSPTW